jgi:hypothetical protein
MSRMRPHQWKGFLGYGSQYHVYRPMPPRVALQQRRAEDPLTEVNNPPVPYTCVSLATDLSDTNRYDRLLRSVWVK